MESAPHSLGAKFTIRDYCARDLEALWQIDQRCFPPGIAYSRATLRDFLAGRTTVALVAELHDQPLDSSGAIAGFVVGHCFRHHGRILTLDVLPETRRTGLGTKLMQGCEERLRAVGCSEVYLETAVDNDAALRLYRKLGYEVLAILPEYYFSNGLDAFRMRKRL